MARAIECPDCGSLLSPTGGRLRAERVEDGELDLKGYEWAKFRLTAAEAETFSCDPKDSGALIIMWRIGGVSRREDDE